MKKMGYIVLIFSSFSCLKKIEEVEAANTNIYDPEYAGSQWWVYDNVYLYTSPSNQQYVRFKIQIPQENVPKLKPTKIPLAVTVNNGNTYYEDATFDFYGDYELLLDILPLGVSEFCLDIGLYIEDEDKIINNFIECKSL